jgi:hypothetical protein
VTLKPGEKGQAGRGGGATTTAGPPRATIAFIRSTELAESNATITDVVDDVAISVWELPGGLRAPAAARRAVRSALAGTDHAAIDAVVLLTSELVTNAVVRGGAGAVLTVEAARSSVVVTVADGRPDSPALSGLARAVLEDLNVSWGAHVHQSGKAVWFRMVAEEGVGAGTVSS